MNDIFPLRAPNLAARVFEGEAIIMNPADSTLFSLNETASAIWLAADGSTSLREIVERDICHDSDVDPDTAVADAAEFAHALAAHGILILNEKPGTPAEGTP